MCLVGIIGAGKAFAAKAEIYLAETGSVRGNYTLYYDADKNTRSGVIVGWTDWDGTGQLDWDTKRAIEKITLHSSMKDARPTNLSSWFESMENLSTIVNLDYLNTSEVTKMAAMFRDCESLEAVDLSHFNTSKVTYMGFYGMFDGCKSIEKLDLRSFDISQLKGDNSTMFSDCESLKTILCDVNWSENPNLDYRDNPMFDGCTSLVGGNGTTYDPDHVALAYARPDVEGQPGYFTESPRYVYGVLSNNNKTLTLYYDKECAARGGNTDWSKNYNSAKEYHVTKIVLDESMKNAKPTSTSFWFGAFTELTEIQHLDYLNTSEVTDMEGMFAYCYALEKADVSHFDTRKVTNMSEMFASCESLSRLDVQGFDTREVTSMYIMFSFCAQVRKLDLRNFNMEKVENAEQMFYGCKELEEILCNDDWSLLNLDNADDMFDGCTSLVGGNGTEYDKNYVDAQYARPDLEGQPGYFTTFDELYGAVSGSTLTLYYDHLRKSRNGLLDWSAFSDQNITKIVVDDAVINVKPTSMKNWFANFSKVTAIEGTNHLNTWDVTDMSGMFSNCSALEAVSITGFLTWDVTDMSNMFLNCKALKEIDLSQINTMAVTNMSGMFSGCEQLTELDVESFFTWEVTNMSKMFYRCKALTTIYCSTDWSFVNSLAEGGAENMFYGCTKLVGGNGTKYSIDHVEEEYARPDEPDDYPGYFTVKENQAIKTVNGDSASYKYIRHGQLIIDRNGHLYNATGARVK